MESCRLKWQVVCTLSTQHSEAEQEGNNQNKNFHLKFSDFCSHATGHSKLHGQTQSQGILVMRPWHSRDTELGTMLYPSINGNGRMVVLPFVSSALTTTSERNFRKMPFFFHLSKFLRMFSAWRKLGAQRSFYISKSHSPLHSRPVVFLPIILSKKLSEFYK